ncbi:MAG TPA: tetratricopeptide repeat protein [Phycisphaerae bacterium]|nr:tetratricopeptide repeat protein [Phycisphaerae bacterium]
MLSVRDLQAGGDARAGRTQHFDVLMELGDCHAALGELDQAVECYLEAVELEPRRAGPHVGLGIAALQAGQLDDAEYWFAAAARHEPDCAEAYGGLAIVHQQREDFAAAFDMHLKCLELDTDNLVALLGLFQTSCQMGSFAKVIQYLDLYLQRHPGDTSVLFCLATLYAREGRFENARGCLRSVLALEPTKHEARDMLRQVEEHIRPTEALDALSA